VKSPSRRTFPLELFKAVPLGPPFPPFSIVRHRIIFPGQRLPVVPLGLFTNPLRMRCITGSLRPDGSLGRPLMGSRPNETGASLTSLTHRSIPSRPIARASRSSYMTPDGRFRVRARVFWPQEFSPRRPRSWAPCGRGTGNEFPSIHCRLNRLQNLQDPLSMEAPFWIARPIRGDEAYAGPAESIFGSYQRRVLLTKKKTAIFFVVMGLGSHHIFAFPRAPGNFSSPLVVEVGRPGHRRRRIRYAARFFWGRSSRRRTTLLVSLIAGKPPLFQPSTCAWPATTIRTIQRRSPLWATSPLATFHTQSGRLDGLCLTSTAGFASRSELQRSG